MAKVAVVAGYGPGISHSFTRKFGKEGFNLALLARTASRLDAAVAGGCHPVTTAATAAVLCADGTTPFGSVTMIASTCRCVAFA